MSCSNKAASMKKVLKRLLLILCLVTGVFLSGCIVDYSRIPDNDNDAIPWNNQAEWESDLAPY